MLSEADVCIAHENFSSGAICGMAIDTMIQFMVGWKLSPAPRPVRILYGADMIRRASMAISNSPASSPFPMPCLGTECSCEAAWKTPEVRHLSRVLSESFIKLQEMLATAQRRQKCCSFLRLACRRHARLRTMGGEAGIWKESHVLP